MRRRVLRLALVIAAAVAALVSPGAPASAHTELDFTLPAEGTTVGEPVSLITIGFTQPVTLVGNGFEVLDPQGNVVMPFPVTDDDMVFRLPFDPPLAGGVVGVRWAVTSQDGHVIEGAFTFTVAAEPPPPTTTTLAPATSAAPTSVSGTTVPATTAVVATTAPEATVVVATAATPTTTADTDDADADDDSDDGTATVAIVIGLLVVAIAAGAFVVVRSRRSTRP